MKKTANVHDKFGKIQKIWKPSIMYSVCFGNKLFMICGIMWTENSIFVLRKDKNVSSRVLEVARIKSHSLVDIWHEGTTEFLSEFCGKNEDNLQRYVINESIYLTFLFLFIANNPSIWLGKAKMESDKIATCECTSWQITVVTGRALMERVWILVAV